VNVAQPARFVAVGAAGYAVNLLAFAVLYAAGTPYAVASVVAYLVSNALMYLGNRYFTFRLGHLGFWSAYARYLLVGLLVGGLTAIVLTFFVEALGLQPTLGQALALLVITPVAFVLIKRWTFQLREPGSATVGRASR
jgi:putative flippase GtrA